MNGHRVGMGYDVHQLVIGRDLIIGGVKIDHEKGLDGHSDADVLLHAIMDAMFGAAGMGDIGWHFPPTDMRFKDVDSSQLLGQTKRLLASIGFNKVINIDAVIMAENPKMAPHIPAMREKIAEVLKIEPNLINIKATTTEKLGFVGREEGIAAQAVCLISSDG